MRRALLVLVALLVALTLAERWLAGRELHPRAVGALFAPEEAERLRHQPALTVELAGASHRYGRVAGRWRCLSYHDAPADGRALQELLDGIARAEGVVHADSSAEAPAFGINTPRTITLAIQGPRAQSPGGDVQAELEVGLALSTASGASSGCFVRKKGTREIWSIVDDLRAPLEARLAPGLPPLLAPSAVPEAWLEQGELLRVTLARGAERQVVERRERELDPQTSPPGLRPWKWVRVGSEGPGGEAEVSEGYPSFLLRLPYVDVLDPARRAEVGLDTPAATLTLEARAGAPLVLAFGARDAGGRVALWVADSGTLYLVGPETFRLALPDAPLLATPPGDEDPWSQALRAAGH